MQIIVQYIDTRIFCNFLILVSASKIHYLSGSNVYAYSTKIHKQTQNNNDVMSGSNKDTDTGFLVLMLIWEYEVVFVNMNGLYDVYSYEMH